MFVNCNIFAYQLHYNIQPKNITHEAHGDKIESVDNEKVFHKFDIGMSVAYNKKKQLYRWCEDKEINSDSTYIYVIYVVLSKMVSPQRLENVSLRK